MPSTPNPLLVVGAVLSFIAALGHLGCIAFGAPWYRFFGAGEGMARMAEAGNPRAAILTSCIAAVLIGWGLYALSAADVVGKLPLLRTILIAATGIYLLRALGAIVLVIVSSAPSPLGRSAGFWWWSSAICLILGAVHLVGLAQVWSRL